MLKNPFKNYFIRIQTQMTSKISSFVWSC